MRVTPDAGGRRSRETLVACEHFVMESVRPRPDVAVELDTGGATPHVITALPGSHVALTGTAWHETLGPLESVVIAASAGRYRITVAGAEPSAALLARLPD